MSDADGGYVEAPSGAAPAYSTADSSLFRSLALSQAEAGRRNSDGFGAGAAGGRLASSRHVICSCRHNPFVPLSAGLAVMVVALGVAVGFLVADDTKAGSPVPAGHFEFVHLTDVHYDPLYDPTAACTGYCRRSVVDGGPGSACNGTAPLVPSTAPLTAPFGRWGCDAPKALVKSAFGAAAAASPHAAFVLVTGDVAAHNLCGTHDHQGACDGTLSATLVREALTETAQWLRDAFPDTPILVNIGNNDSPAHYQTPLGANNADFASFLRNLWEPLSKCQGCSAAAPTYTVDWSGWEQGFYYSASGIVPGLRIVMLNTLLYIRQLSTINYTHTGGLAAQQAAGHAQLSWLGAQLVAAADAGEKVVITSHVPYGMQPYDDKPVWDDELQQLYADLLCRHTATVDVSLFGHFHYDSFRVLAGQCGDAGTTPPKTTALLAPSVSPISHNNAAFRVMEGADAPVAGTGKVLTDYVQHWADVGATRLMPNLNSGDARAGADGEGGGTVGTASSAAGVTANDLQWRESYRFSEAYGCSLQELAALPAKVNADDGLYSEFTRNHAVNFEPFKYHYTCAMSEATLERFQQCMAANAVYDEYDVRTLSAPR